jgi:hypothetical protein
VTVEIREIILAPAVGTVPQAAFAGRRAGRTWEMDEVMAAERPAVLDEGDRLKAGSPRPEEAEGHRAAASPRRRDVPPT